jgi:hypothetical protein
MNGKKGPKPQSGVAPILPRRVSFGSYREADQRKDAETPRRKKKEWKKAGPNHNSFCVLASLRLCVETSSFFGAFMLQTTAGCTVLVPSLPGQKPF